jgi:hypothetical protein
LGKDAIQDNTDKEIVKLLLVKDQLGESPESKIKEVL